jgi:hypothetical protein
VESFPGFRSFLGRGRRKVNMTVRQIPQWDPGDPADDLSHDFVRDAHPIHPVGDGSLAGAGKLLFDRRGELSPAFFAMLGDPIFKFQHGRSFP